MLIRSRGYKNRHMLNSAEHENFPAIVGILTFRSRKKGILGLSEPKKVYFLYLEAFKSSCSAELSKKSFYNLWARCHQS